MNHSVLIGASIFDGCPALIPERLVFPGRNDSCPVGSPAESTARVGGSRGFFRAIAIIYAVLTVMGLVPALSTTFGLIPLYGGDVALHTVLALAGAYFDWMHRDTAGDRN